MPNNRFCEWQPILLYGEGQQPRLGRHWYCVPAWDITAIHKGPDQEVPHPDAGRAAPDHASAHPDKDKKKYVFWDRHIDRRFHIEYPLASREIPRAQGRTIGDTDREWDVLIEYRDRYLRDAGLTLASPPAAIAKCLADTFGCDSYFKDKPLCQTFPGDERSLEHPIEGLLHQSFCVGCAEAAAALMDSAGLPARVIGIKGHALAEVYVDGRWHMVDSVGRHAENRGLDLYFKTSYMDSMLDPAGAHGDGLSDNYRKGLWQRQNPQFHLMAGTWLSSKTLNYACESAHACYPYQKRWGIVSSDGHRLPIMNRNVGFFYPRIHNSVDNEATRLRRQTIIPLRIEQKPVAMDFLYHPLRPGEKLRQSFYLDALDDCTAIEIIFNFGATRSSDFSEQAGRSLFLRVGEFRKSLAALGAWPPKGQDAGGNLISTVTLPADVFQPKAVNWIVLEQMSGTVFYAPCIPSCLEPYMPPLWSETGDRFNPPLFFPAAATPR